MTAVPAQSSGAQGRPAGDACLGPDGEGCESLQNDLGWGLGVVFRGYLKATDAALADLPGGPRGYQVLTVAGQGMAGTQLALANQLGIDRTVMTYLLDDLEKAGLIERQPDPGDRRARRIVVTAAGRVRSETAYRRMREVEDAVLAALPEADRETFRTMLRRVATWIDSDDPAGTGCTVVEEIAAKDHPAVTPRRRARR